MGYLLSGFYTIIFLYLIYRLNFFEVKGFSKRTVSAVFLLKILSGFLLTWIYTDYYTDRCTADIYKYFDDSSVLYDALFTRPVDFLRMMSGIMNNNEYFDVTYYSKMNHWFRPFGDSYYNDTQIMIRFNAFVRLFSFGHFPVHTIFINFISLIGLIIFYRTFYPFKKTTAGFLFAAICLAPSLLFWGSGVLKEGLIIFLIGFLCHSFFQLIHRPFEWKFLFLFLLIAYMMIRLKFYILIALTGPMLAYWWVEKSGRRKMTLKYLATMLILLLISLNLHHFSPAPDLLEIITTKQKDFISLGEFTGSGSLMDIKPLQPRLASFFQALPESLVNGFLRPWLWESASLFMLASALENFFLLTILLIILLFFRTSKEQLPLNLLLMSISFVIILNSMIGMTTPVLGALVRYKLPSLPFMLLIITLITDIEKLKRTWSSWKPKK